MSRRTPRLPVATATASPGAIRGPFLHPRICAWAVLFSSAVHLWMATGEHHPVWMRVLMLVMVGACLPCAVHIWKHSSVKALQQVAACAVAMAALHLLLVLAAPSSGHVHGEVSSHGASAAGSTLLIIAVEMGLALTAATLVARLRAREGGLADSRSERT